MGNNREIRCDATSKENVAITILDNIEFYPFKEYRIPVSECIQFHSKAFPENRILSNHYDCIIRFRDCEFYGAEQMFLGLTYSESPHTLKEIMLAKDGVEAKKICRKKYKEARDSDFNKKRHRLIALCHLYKYLSVREYRDRLRETYPQTLVESPSGKHREFGVTLNLDTNTFEGCNCSGRTSMIVRDMMLQLENEAIAKRELELGQTLTDTEREEVIAAVCDNVRAKFDADKRVLQDSNLLFAFIEQNNIPRTKTRRPEPEQIPIVDKKSRGVIISFDNTLFDTSAFPAKQRKGNKGKVVAIEHIPDYTLYDGWREVLDWCVVNNVKIGILSEAVKELPEKTVNYHNIPCDSIVGYKMFMRKADPKLALKLLEALNIREEQAIYIGSSDIDEIRARCSNLRFFGSTWHRPNDNYFEQNGIPTLSNPRDIIPILEKMTHL